MTETEKQNSIDTKQKIRDRYRGVDTSKLTIIPAKPPKSALDGGTKRVAPYIRVSTDNDEQTSSYELQKNYFTEYVNAQPGWVLVDIYSDEGISGTQIDHREGLQRLLEDCRAGKIDYIITKSISRFARNIVDCLSMIEELSNLNPPVGVIFETDHIDTLGGKDGLVLSILASLAEAESRTKSEIMNWSIENRFSRGIFLLPELLGFDKDEEGNLVINDDEADTVRLCFYLFVAGFSLTEIAELLTEMERKTGYNKQHNKKPGVTPEYNTNWSANSVLSILRNERHCGDVLARKTFTPNFKNHKAKKNRGERQQVQKLDDHEGIVSREVFEAANRKLDLSTGRQSRRYPIMKVIDEGALKGFVPVDRTWSGFSVEDFKVASMSAYGKEEREEEPAVSGESALSNFQVVRAQLFSTKLYPAVTISRGKIRFNTACLKRFEDVEYVELLFNSVEKCLAVRPCERNNPNAIQWGALKEGRWVVKEKSCRGFSAPLFETMGWNDELRYRMRGSYLGEGDDRVMIFDLEETEIIERVLIEDIPSVPDETKMSEEQESKPKYRNVITFNSGGIFGHSYDEDVHILERVHYSGNWDVLRPAREVYGVNPITDDDIDALLQEAERIMDKLRVTA